MDTLELIALPRRRAVEVSGLTERQLTYWTKTSLLEPAIVGRLTQRARHLYDYRDLMSLLVAKELRDRGISTQYIRQVVNYLREQGYPSPLTEVRFAVLGGRVYFQHPDGEWEISDRLRGQLVLSEVLRLEPLRARLRAAVKRAQHDGGKVEQRRGAMGSTPVFAGTRIPVKVVRNYLAHGFTVDQVIEAFPDLMPADVEQAAVV